MLASQGLIGSLALRMVPRLQKPQTHPLEDGQLQPAFESRTNVYSNESFDGPLNATMPVSTSKTKNGGHQMSGHKNGGHLQVLHAVDDYEN
jgi:hypothetical protein